MASSVGSISSTQRVEAYTPPAPKPLPQAPPPIAKVTAPRRDSVDLSPEATAAVSDFDRK